MIHANIAEVKSKLSHFLRLVKGGERVLICDRNRPIAELVPVAPPIDRKLRESAFGMFTPTMTQAELEEALRPMTDREAEDFIEGKY
ncbi:MAG TPA: type II toxin-antitoxin system prevent-host-death family antitoxin [Fimbriimonadaceae bacterium]